MGLEALLAAFAAFADAEDPSAVLAAAREQTASLSAADLSRLETALVAAFDLMYGDEGSALSPEQVATLTAIGEVTTAVRERIAAFAAAAEHSAALRTAMHPPAPPAPPVVEPPAAPPAPVISPAASEPPAAPAAHTPAPDVPVTPEPAAVATTVATPDAAAAVTTPPGPSLAAMSAARPTALATRPEGTPSGTRARSGLFASSGSSPNLPVGNPIGSMDELGEIVYSTLRASNSRAFGERHLARWQTDYPEERRLGQNVRVTEERINAVTSVQAIVASGGVCNPVNVDYTVPTWGDGSRPLLDALPTFNADRGGLRFVAPPKLSDTMPQAATAVWPETLDASPSSSTKALGTIVCGSEQEVFVDAIPTRIKVGNMQARYSPEQVAADTKVAMVQAARVAELNLLAKITAASTSVETNRLLGAHRDFLAVLDVILARFNYQHRMPVDQRYRVLLPYWALRLFSADILREHAHDDVGTPTRALTIAVVNSWFTARNCNATWLMDSEPVDSAPLWSSGPTPVSQQFGTQAVAYANNWPTELHFWLFPEGSFLHLDGGTLNLGVVRDSILDGTNDYETFVEIFESVAFRGVESLRVVTNVLPTGQSALPIATSAAPSILVGGSTTGHGNGGSF